MKVKNPNECNNSDRLYAMLMLVVPWTKWVLYKNVSAAVVTVADLGE